MLNQRFFSTWHDCLPWPICSITTIWEIWCAFSRGRQPLLTTRDPSGFATSTSDPCHTPGASRCASRCFHRLGAVRCAPQEVPSRGGRQSSWSSLSNRLDFNRLFANLSGSKYLIVRAILQVRDLMVRLRHVLASLVKCSSSLQQVAFILSIIQFPWPLSLSRGQLPLQDH